MPADGSRKTVSGPLPHEFLELLDQEEELLVSSRDQSGQGTVRMWFAVIPPGYVYLLTPTYTRKAERWRDDPWVRLRVPGSDVFQEGVVVPVDWDEAETDIEVLTSRFSMAGAATGEALRWMLQDGSRKLLRVEVDGGSEGVESV